MVDTPVELIIPGLFDSGPDHWQTRWLALRPNAVRVELGRWHEPSRDLWVAHLDRAVGRQREPVVLVAHSLGCLAVAWWAREASAARLSKVHGAMLVAPPDVDRPGAHPLLRPFAPAPLAPLPFPTLLVASQDDRYAEFERLGWLAGAWDSELVDVGRLGHINAESDLGDWPRGIKLLDRLTGNDQIAKPRSSCMLMSGSPARRRAASQLPKIDR
ncbi:alpha/beta hydrolase [Sphingomonas sp. CGMCC 1.13654]|uniref:Alpha/beta hydrolase n=1 Tax=Sphingomonas chungangi TaxID=2683589 RepID=A0A838L669_9SPHN|nr:alpha/beta hydrolase [Sphingomonas chungangi]